MSFYLIVPPILFLSANLEFSPDLLQEANAWSTTQLQNLNINSEPKFKISSGAFNKTKIFTWDKNYNGLLLSVFVLDVTQSKYPTLKANLLVRQADCVALGANWEITKNGQAQVPINATSVSLTQIADRNLDNATSFRFDNHLNGDRFGQVDFFLSLVGAELFASQKVPLNSSVERIYCDAKLVKEIVQMSAYPAKAHRIIENNYKVAYEKTNKLPKIIGETFITSGVFGEKKEEIVKIASEKPLNTQTLVQQIYDVVKSKVHKLDTDKFKIIKRDGRFVYLDRGKAFGLQIGVHLLGNGSTLHVIQYSQEFNDYDVAVALIRTEDKTKPLQVGDEITFDLRK